MKLRNREDAAASASPLSQSTSGRARPGDPYLVESIVRCCRVLRAFQTRGGELPLHTIARRTGLSTSLVFRLLHTLRHIGWIEKRDRTYRRLVRVPRQQRKDRPFSISKASALRSLGSLRDCLIGRSRAQEKTRVYVVAAGFWSITTHRLAHDIQNNGT